MSSPFSHALRKLDDSLQTIQARLDCLGAALEADDDELSHSLTYAGQHAAILCDLIRAERPDANWSDRRSLEQLIHELETSAEVSHQQQRRTKLLELANELDAGRVKHRTGRRTTELETLRREAVKQLRTEAAVSEPVKDLPGPPASEWLHWAWSLKDPLDASVLVNLRRDFAAADRFAGEMVERYWIPGQGVDERPRQASEPSLRAAEECAAESPASPSSQPVAPAGTDHDELPQNVTAQSDEVAQRGNHAEAFDSSRRSVYPEFEQLVAAAQRHRSAADESFWSFAEPVPHKRQLFPWVGAVGIVVLGGIFAVLYGFNAPTSSKPHPTVATAGGKTYRAVKHSPIQKDRKQLLVVKGSSIQVTAPERSVPLLALSSSKQDLQGIETLASAAGGVKVVSNEIQVEARNPYPLGSSAKGPEQDVRFRPFSSRESNRLECRARAGDRQCS